MQATRNNSHSVSTETACPTIYVYEENNGQTLNLAARKLGLGDQFSQQTLYHKESMATFHMPIYRLMPHILLQNIFTQLVKELMKQKQDISLPGQFVMKLHLKQQWNHHKRQMLMHLVENGQVLAQMLSDFFQVVYSLREGLCPLPFCNLLE